MVQNPHHLNVYSTEKLKHKSISLKPLYVISDTVNNCIKRVVKNLFVSLKYQMYRSAGELQQHRQGNRTN